jgi:hypothetical protein
MSAPAGMPCPRCGYPTDAAAGPFCPHCGRYLATLQWVAEPPRSATPPRPVPMPTRYTGPPHYRERPRGGFAPGPWRPSAGAANPGGRTGAQTALPHTLPGGSPAPPPPPEQPARALAAVTVPLLWALVAVTLLACGAEIWRYTLLLTSRTGALSADAVAASDALVLAAGVGAVLLGLAAGGLLGAWPGRASVAAAARSGSRPSRPARDVVLGWVVPGLNLAVPGSVVAEIEHGALDRPPGARPRPSRLAAVWWALWAAGVLASIVTIAWSRRTGVQAQADGVVLHAALDLLAAVTAGVTATLVSRLTALLGPVRAPRREIVLAVSSGPTGSRAERAVTPSATAPATPA